MLATLGATAIGLEIVFGWPQALRTLRCSDVSGVSPTAAMMMVLTAASWALYGVLIGDAVVVSANVAMGLGVGVNLAALACRGGLRAVTAGAATAAWVAITGAAALTAGSLGIGLVAAVIGLSSAGPQAARAMLSRTAEGVSLLTYLLLLGVQVTWLAYGLAASNALIAATNVVGVAITSSAVAAILVRSRSPKAPAPAWRADAGPLAT